MGDDIEIRQLIRRESENILQTALSQSKEVGTYNLDVEFAKTKANKSFVVIGATAITIAILGTAAFLTTKAIQRSIDATPVDVAAFEDLNLKDILDTSKRNESDMERAKSDLTTLASDLQANLKAADRDYQSSVESIKARALGADEEGKRLAAAKADADAKRAKLQSGYTAAAAKKRADIADIQKRIDQYDSRMMEQAKKEQAVLDNQRSAFDIEKQKQAQQYEARIADLEAARERDVTTLKQQKDDLAASLTSRYNPNLSDARSSALLSGYVMPPAAPLANYHPYLGPAGILNAAADAKLQKSLSDLEYLSEKLRAVPYINSVPGALARIEAEARSAVAAYRAALAAAGAGLQSRDETIAARDKTIVALTARAEAAERSLEQYRNAVAAYAQANREAGYLVDVRDPAKLLVYLEDGASVPEGKTGYVVRGDKTIATIVFGAGNAWTNASVSHLEEGEELRAFDAVLIEASAAEQR